MLSFISSYFLKFWSFLWIFVLFLLFHLQFHWIIFHTWWIKKMWTNRSTNQPNYKVETNSWSRKILFSCSNFGKNWKFQHPQIWFADNLCLFPCLPVVLKFGNLTPSIDYFSKLEYMHIWTHKKFGEWLGQFGCFLSTVLYMILARGACMRCHGTKCPLLTAFFFFSLP